MANQNLSDNLHKEFVKIAFYIGSFISVLHYFTKDLKQEVTAMRGKLDTLSMYVLIDRKDIDYIKSGKLKISSTTPKNQPLNQSTDLAFNAPILYYDNKKSIIQKTNPK